MESPQKARPSSISESCVHALCWTRGFQGLVSNPTLPAQHGCQVREAGGPAWLVEGRSSNT